MMELSPPHPLRSALYVPANKVRAIEKAKRLDCDGVILDLEDAVAPSEKIAARDALCALLQNGGFGTRRLLVRVNGLDSVWGQEDLAALGRLQTQARLSFAILLPKVDGPEDIAKAQAFGKNFEIWAMMETAKSMFNAQPIAAAACLGGMVLGTNDLAAELGATDGQNRFALQTALQLCLLAAKSQGLTILDGVYNAFHDDAGLMAEAQQGRDLGFDGKTLIHPAQLAIANQIFAPSAAAIALAKRQINAFDAAMVNGQAVAVLDGKIIENLHIIRAQKTLALAQGITDRAGDPES